MAFEEAPYPDKEGGESDRSGKSVTRFLRLSSRPRPCKDIPQHVHAFVDISVVISLSLAAIGCLYQFPSTVDYTWIVIHTLHYVE